MTFNRADYERIVQIAREIVAQTDKEGVIICAWELFQMAEKVIGQQSPTLIKDPS